MLNDSSAIESGIIEMKKVGTVLKALENQTPDFFDETEAQRAIQTVKELFDCKMQNLENAFYGAED